MLRCKCPRCAAATLSRILAILAVCIALPKGLKLILEDYDFVSKCSESLPAARNGQSNQLDESSPAVQPQEVGWPDPSSQIASSQRSDPHKESANPRLFAGRFNAALAAGLIDPPKVDLIPPLIETLKAKRPPVILLNSSVSAQNRAGGAESGVPFVAVAGPTLPTSSLPALPKLGLELPALTGATDKTVNAVPRETKENDPNSRFPSVTLTRENHRSSPTPQIRPISFRFVARAAVKTSDNGSTQRSVRRNDVSPTGLEAEANTRQSSSDHHSQSRDLSEDLQRFASDFVRTSDVDHAAEQQRFFADSVHFYREGDLSLASVEAATRRQHRNQQAKRSEVAGPAVATGPVNGGFFVIEQPVRWTQLEGSKVTQGRSVLQLRVVPVSQGNWKITSIDEVKND